MQDNEQHRQDADALADDVFEAPQPALALDEEERLPWLESADDEDEDGGVDTARLMRFALFGLSLVVLVGGGLWIAAHRGPLGDVVAEGGVIKAPAEPYKSVPNDQGGKTYAGTGDSAFVVSEGKNPTAKLDEGLAPAPAPAPIPGPALAAGANVPAETAGGVGVQVGAYSSLATAEAGWQRLSGNNEALKGLKHRVVEGSADIGTVYRLQAVAPDVAGANALCATLKGAGVACQVKR
jgi:hypothetical protein